MLVHVGSGTYPVSIARGDVCIDTCKRPGNRPPSFICADAHRLPFAEEVFDRVYMFAGIEHAECSIQCLREVHKCLKKNGASELTTPNIFHWRIILRQVRGLPALLSNTGHISCWSEAELRNVLLNAGFSSFRFSYETLPRVFSPHKALDKIARLTLPCGISEMNIIARTIKPETKIQ